MDSLQFLTAVFLLLPLLYDFGPSRFRYFLKISVYYVGLTLIACFVVPVSMLTPRRVENMIVPAKLTQMISRLLGLRFSILGVERLREQTSYVVVVNHQHSIDVLALVEMWPEMRRCTTVGKLVLMFAGPFGVAAWLCGTTFINRSHPAEAREILNRTVSECKNAKTKVLIFPEGTRHHNPQTKELLPFKKGAFGAAVASRVPVLPVVISHYKFLDTENCIFDPAVIEIHVMEPISTDGYSATDEGVTKLAELTREKMLEKFRNT